MKNHNPYNGGIADCWYSGARADWWVEYKFVVLPKRDNTVIDSTAGKQPLLSHLQQDWLRERHTEGRNVAVIIGCKDGGVWLPRLAWDKPLTTEEFRQQLLTRTALAELLSRLTR